jgi:lipopolysaccharide/colanic/teichoic acid biosynthesis glycosyltransferase
MLALDIEYVERRSTWLDLRIMARTAGVMLSGA